MNREPREEIFSIGQQIHWAKARCREGLSSVLRIRQEQESSWLKTELRSGLCSQRFQLKRREVIPSSKNCSYTGYAGVSEVLFPV